MNSVQCRMARAALDWSSRQIAAAAGVPCEAVARFQTGQAIQETEIKRMRAAFEEAGIVFVDDGNALGVQLKKRAAPDDVGPKPSGPASTPLPR